MLSKKLLIRIGLNTLLGVVLVIIWLQFVNLEEIWQTLQKVQAHYILIFLFLFCLATVLRGLRLKLLLNNHSLPAKNLISLNFVSQLLSFFIPIRAGEITKSVYLSTQHKLPLAKVVVWVFVDRLLDMFGVLIFMGILIFVVPNDLGNNIGILILLLVLWLLVMAVLSVVSQSKAKALVLFLSKFLVFEKLKKIFLNISTEIIEGFLVLKKEHHELLGLVLLTFFALLTDSMIWFVSFWAVKEHISFFTAIFGSQLSALTFLIPAAPGYVGSLEASALAVWSLVLGIGSDITSASAILFHILTILGLLIFGVGSVYFLKIDLSAIFKKIKGK